MSELKRLIVDELHALAGGYDDIDQDAVVIVSMPSSWRAVLKQRSARLDEAKCAAVSEVANRLARGFDVAAA